MRSKGLHLTAGVLCAAAAGLLVSQSRPSSTEDQLWNHRNLGKAFYENPATQMQAVEEFRKALDLAPDSLRERLNYGLALLRAGKTSEGAAEIRKAQAKDPKLPHTWFNLGIVHKKNGETEQAVRMFERMVQLVPEDAVSHYNLGALYKLENRLPEALAKFQKASQLQPSLAAPHFQLYNAYRLAGKREDAASELTLFQEIKKAQEASGSTEDVEWNEYAEIYDPIDPALSTADAADPAPRFISRQIATIGAGNQGALVLDSDSDAVPDLLIWSTAGARLLRAGVTPVEADLGAGRQYAAADVNNDGFPELCALTASGVELFWNRKGKYEKAAKPLAAGDFSHALWLDYDHDYDPDLLLFGEKPALLRNQGEAGLIDRTADFPFFPGATLGVAAFRLIPDTKSVDVLASYGGRGTILYRDRLAGKFERVLLDFTIPGAFAVWDWNHDGAFDLAYAGSQGLHLLANIRGSFKQQRVLSAASGGAFADVTNGGMTQIVAGGLVVHPLVGAPRKAEGLAPGRVLAVADFNKDGRADVVTASGDRVYLNENVTAAKNRWLTVRLLGTKNPKLAQGAEVEIRAGRHYQKKLYEGYPLQFGLRGYEKIDAVRITWPNGLIQNEANQAGSRMAEYKEAPRLSGSCPTIFTWDGRRFRFLTDVLGVAPLGASAGGGQYFPTDHDEYVWTPGEVLDARDGRYEVRVTEELGEVTYLDQVKLIAVDHPADVEIYSNDKWKSPPYPEFRLFGTKQRIRPIRAVDHRGNDVLARIRARDRVYADTFARTMSNTAEMHAIEMAFPADVPSGGVFLALDGWVDWPDGSTFVRQSQEPGRALLPPYLQVRDANGRWKTVIEDMGLPSGKTKTIAVDLSGKFLSSSREIRIVTNLCVYWDEIFLGVETEKPPLRLHTLPLDSAELAFHGFSRAAIHPERRQPERFEYEPAAATSSWNPTPGLYTRYGDVKPLLGEPDDRFIIMGSGDEVRLAFRAQAPRLPDGWRRDFLLYFDGWAKDSDANTAWSQSVEPLPFHRMTGYPFRAGQRSPDGALHRAWREQYNTRPALRLLRSIAP
ncbi:MAG: VCBS repeat-containing protein [Acidobacteria bacterium]|nr:VCBS repeat-containing protein [Acidobacteriota bacterium]